MKSFFAFQENLPRSTKRNSPVYFSSLDIFLKFLFFPVREDLLDGICTKVPQNSFACFRKRAGVDALIQSKLGLAPGCLNTVNDELNLLVFLRSSVTGEVLSTR